MLVPSIHTSACVDSGGAEGLPDDCLTDVGCNKERDTRAQTVALLKQLIQQQDNQTCNKKLKKQARGLYWADSGRQQALYDETLGKSKSTRQGLHFEISASHVGRRLPFYFQIVRYVKINLKIMWSKICTTQELTCFIFNPSVPQAIVDFMYDN